MRHRDKNNDDEANKSTVDTTDNNTTMNPSDNNCSVSVCEETVVTPSRISTVIPPGYDGTGTINNGCPNPSGSMSTTD